MKEEDIRKRLDELNAVINDPGFDQKTRNEAGQEIAQLSQLLRAALPRDLPR